MNKFLILIEHFPLKAHKLAESVGMNIGELRAAILRDDYYIDDNAELIENKITKAINELSDAIIQAFPRIIS